MTELEKMLLQQMNVLETNMIALHAKLDTFMKEKLAEIEGDPLQDISRRAEYIRKLDSMKKVIVDKCSCGEHKGIRFVDENGSIAEDAMCPRDWWIYKSRLAFIDGTFDEFVESTPLEVYLNYGK